MNEDLLAPIRPDSPCGGDLRLDAGDTRLALLDELRSEVDPELDPEGLGREPDWSALERECDDLLATRSKDLQIAAYRAEARARIHGSRGLADGLELISALLDRYWPELHPGVNEGGIDFPIRSRWLRWLAGPSFRRSLEASPLSDISECLDWLRTLDTVCREHFPLDETPDFAELAAFLSSRVDAEAMEQQEEATASEGFVSDFRLRPHFQLEDAAGASLELSVELERPNFTVYQPRTIARDTWTTLLAYIHLASAAGAVAADHSLSNRPMARRPSDGQATELVARGTEITAVPRLPGCRFNPGSARVAWLEDWHRLEFRVQANAGEAGAAVDGEVAFYAGPILIGAVPIRARIAASDAVSTTEAPTRNAAAPYHKVFVSYSHDDAPIVDALERAYQALGMEYLRDVRTLRSGEIWNERLLDLIESADIFQLCWSQTASNSEYVEREWQHARSLDREAFVRPVYWNKPLAAPPEALADLHFAYVPLG